MGQGKSDPFCICESVGKHDFQIQTPIVNDSLDPMWNYTRWVTYVVGDSLTFTIYDKDVGTKDDLLGKASLPSEQFYPGGFDGEIPLEECGQAQSFLRITIAATEVVQEADVEEKCEDEEEAPE